MPFPPPGRTLRVIGFDDVPWRHRRSASVGLVGVVCAGTRFEGMVYGRVRRDGWNATDEIVRLLERGKFLPQLHLVLLDGIAFGGFNLVDLPRLASALRRPCVSVMPSCRTCRQWSARRSGSPARSDACACFAVPEPSTSPGRSCTRSAAPTRPRRRTRSPA